MEPHTSICKEDAAPAGTTTPPANTKGTKGESCDEHLIDIDIWHDAKVSHEKERTTGESGLPRIWIPKVPATLRNIKNPKLPQWIEPSMISIGPYHYGRMKFAKTQKRKYGNAENFIRESKQKEEDLCHKIEEKLPVLKKCYDNRLILKFTDKTLTTMFLLDGCFLLHFIYYSSEKDGFSNLGFTSHEIAYIEQDLFLLENQLPYKVLKLLFEGGEFPKRSMEDRIEDFVASHVPLPRGISAEVKYPEPYHLLHFLQGVMLGEQETTRPLQKHDKEDKGRRRPKLQSCKNVQELKKAGIHFKPSASSFLTDISFKANFGITGCLKLPPISMNTLTMIIFLNLMAFESSNATNNLGVISYLCFLDSLIDRWNDVKELQAAGILYNFLGDQGEVAQFFNIVCSHLVPNPSAYEDVILQIESHVERHNSNRLRKWYIQCKHTYFSSPWSIIALIGAIIGLSLTAIQTYTSVFSQ